MAELPDIHDTTDADYWRGLTVDQLLADIAAQLQPDTHGGPVDDDYATAIAEDALRTISDGIMDRAIDQAECGKADECRAKAVFLTWLAWNIDDRLSPAVLS